MKLSTNYQNLIHTNVYSGKYGNVKINFTGNDTYEKKAESAIGTINHESHFFREPKTDKFVQDYILEHFSENQKLKLVSAACSSGEEVYSYAMMLDSLRDKLQITGFDIDRDSIQKARDGFFTIRNVSKMNDFDITNNAEGFLIDKDADNSDYQKSCKDKFYQYFIPVSKIQTETQKLNLSQKITDAIVKKIYKTEFAPQKYEKQKFKLKDDPCRNCSFEQGDILDTEKLLEPESVNVFMFRNALYHLVCQGNNMMRSMKPEAPQIIDSIARQVNGILIPGGLFVFGEDESLQGVDKGVVYDVMTKNGFEPVIIDENEFEQSKKTWSKLGLDEEDMKKNIVNIWCKQESMETPCSVDYRLPHSN